MAFIGAKMESLLFGSNHRTVNGGKYTGSTDRAAAFSCKRGFLTDLKKGMLPTEMALWRLDEAEVWWIEFRRPRNCTKYSRLRALSPPAFPSHIDQQALAGDLER